jgi:hypothetical protein
MVKNSWLLLLGRLFYATLFLPLEEAKYCGSIFGAILKIFISFFVLFSSFGLCNDTVFQKEIIGSWITGQQDEYFGSEWFITEYKKDGTAVHRQFSDASCETTSIIIKGLWTIKNGQLTNIVLSSSGDFEIPSGIMLVDEIKQLENGEMVISTDTNRTAYRMKSDKCL